MIMIQWKYFCHSLLFFKCSCFNWLWLGDYRMSFVCVHLFCSFSSSFLCIRFIHINKIVIVYVTEYFALHTHIHVNYIYSHLQCTEITQPVISQLNWIRRARIYIISTDFNGTCVCSWLLYSCLFYLMQPFYADTYTNSRMCLNDSCICCNARC